MKKIITISFSHQRIPANAMDSNQKSYPAVCMIVRRNSEKIVFITKFLHFFVILMATKFAFVRYFNLFQDAPMSVDKNLDEKSRLLRCNCS